MSDKITLKAEVAVKESKELNTIQYKATAGMTEEEILKRNTIGELRDNPGASEAGKVTASL